jgi:hypothetical protein
MKMVSSDPVGYQFKPCHVKDYLLREYTSTHREKCQVSKLGKFLKAENIEKLKSFIPKYRLEKSDPAVEIEKSFKVEMISVSFGEAYMVIRKTIKFHAYWYDYEHNLRRFGQGEIVDGCYTGEVIEEFVFGTVTLWNISGGYFNYKTMEENEGPCYYGTPKKILNYLNEHGPVTEEQKYAYNWRKQSMEKFGLKDHQIVIFKYPVHFRGLHRDGNCKFIFRKDGGKTWFEHPGLPYSRLKVSRWKNRQFLKFDVIKDEEIPVRFGDDPDPEVKKVRREQFGIEEK